MRTRTLLLLAVSCGLAILLAGGIQLFRLANQDKPAAPLTVGSTGTAGDAAVTVEQVANEADTLVVTVRVEGVDDPAGVAGFSLVAPNKRLSPVAGAADACGAFTVAAVTCTLTFPTNGLAGSDRQLLLIRAEDQVRWNLV